MTRYKQSARLLDDAIERLSRDAWGWDSDDEDEFAYGFRRDIPAWVKPEADRQWADIPETPEEIRRWMAGEPIGENSDA